jgi:hypothetical protein
VAETLKFVKVIGCVLAETTILRSVVSVIRAKHLAEPILETIQAADKCADILEVKEITAIVLIN